jgi:hypothetical protein
MKVITASLVINSRRLKRQGVKMEKFLFEFLPGFFRLNVALGFMKRELMTRFCWDFTSETSFEEDIIYLNI